MITVVDSNIIVALWDRDDALNAAAQSALDSALDRGSLVVPASVFAELMALPGRTESFLDAFFQDTDVVVDWALDERVWRVAGRAFQSYAGPSPHSGRFPNRRVCCVQRLPAAHTRRRSLSGRFPRAQNTESLKSRAGKLLPMRLGRGLLPPCPLVRCGSRCSGFGGLR